MSGGSPAWEPPELPGADEEPGAWNADPEAWRGTVHLDAWPEQLAGPEYWLWKRQLEDEDGA